MASRKKRNSSKKAKMNDWIDDDEMFDQEATEESTESVFEVEKILDKRIVKGKTEYFLKWKGYDDPAENTWEPKANLNCKSLLIEFERQWEEKRKQEGKSALPAKAVKAPTKLNPVVSRAEWEKQWLSTPSQEDQEMTLTREEVEDCFLNNDTTFDQLDEFYKNLEADTIIGSTMRHGKHWFLVQWKNLEDKDLVPYEYIEYKFPDLLKNLPENYKMYAWAI